VSPVSDIVTSAGLGFHQFMRSANVSEDLEALRICTNRLRYWLLSNGLLLNLDKSEALLVGTYQQ
jgi:hypothetical protein